MGINEVDAQAIMDAQVGSLAALLLTLISEQPTLTEETLLPIFADSVILPNRVDRVARLQSAIDHFKAIKEKLRVKHGNG